MTREEERLEQAKFYIDKGVKDPHIHFLRGAEWADSTMIDKACEWLEENLAKETSLLCSGIVHVNFNSAIRKFKQAMKGE